MSEATLTGRVGHWLSGFAARLQDGDCAGAAAMFGDDCYWRDLVAFSWNITTAEGQRDIQAMLEATVGRAAAGEFVLDGSASEADGVAEGWFTFETGVARGRGHVRLKGDKCWTLLTTMVELKGHEERRGARRENGARHGVVKGRRSWIERKSEEDAALGHTAQPYCLIVGGGQGGIALGARFKQLGVPTIIVERNARPGDSWRKRYRSLCLHDPVWYDHLPYLPFPDHWPVFSPKDKIADWLESYTAIMELDYWGSTECIGARFDEAAGEWVVEVNRAGECLTLRPKHLILATGMLGIPKVPEFPGAENFQGVQHHSSKHAGGEDCSGRKCIVVGSNNSAHDIAADLWEHGADVTMLQRSSTLVAKSETLMELGLRALYSEEAMASGITTDKADLIFASIPYGIMAAMQIPVYEEMARRDAALYRRLEKAGFLLDMCEDGSGLFMKYLRRGSGYYIDVGASDLVADGKIKLRSGVEVREIRAHSLVLDDGSELEADLIVYATGYGSMNGWAAALISQEVADKVGKCWGLGSDTTNDPGPWQGELRNMWKPTQQQALWFHGGNLHQSRHYSQFLALQIKARMEGLATPVYGLDEVHHLS